MTAINLKISSVIALALLMSAGFVLAFTVPQAQTNSATNIQDVSVTLGGNLYDLGGDYSSNVWFQYGTTTSYGYETIRISQNYAGYFNQNVYGLSPNTTYHFRAVVQNSYAINYGQDVTFTTSGLTYNFYAQTNAATNIYNNRATLNGYVYGGTYAIAVWFQYGTSANYGYASNNQQINYSGSVSQTISNLTQNTTYHYRTLAQNSNGQVVYGRDMTFVTGGGAYYQPSSYSAGVLETIKQMLVLIQQMLNNLQYSPY
ncbi:MAG: hypothetical protein HY005_01935 [Candidatus Staskawiczbacteria bacterium]|nr:hypothetical protein [Candidatus Staskawiczbacteria bacterium]